jgi:hypothetical protein
MPVKRRSLAVVIALVSVALASHEASAIGDGSATGGAVSVTIEVLPQQGVQAGAGGGGAPTPTCAGAWQQISTPIADQSGAVLAPTKTENGVDYDLYFLQPTCTDGFAGGSYLYVQRISATDLIPGLREEVERRLPKTEIEFAPKDPQFGWTYVKVNTDFRVTSSLEVVTAEAAAVAGPQVVWASISATPTSVTFEPGEPGGYAVGCSAADAQLGYSPTAPGACSYTYTNTSAVSSNGRSFTTSATVEWSIEFESSDGGGTFPPLTMTSTQDLAVAEYQALVTCTGPRPEQGGC